MHLPLNINISPLLAVLQERDERDNEKQDETEYEERRKKRREREKDAALEATNIVFRPHSPIELTVNPLCMTMAAFRVTRRTFFHSISPSRVSSFSFPSYFLIASSSTSSFFSSPSSSLFCLSRASFLCLFRLELAEATVHSQSSLQKQLSCVMKQTKDSVINGARKEKKRNEPVERVARETRPESERKKK